MTNNTIAILSDTHEHVRMITKALTVIKERSPALVIHCGDIISPPVLERFAGLPLKVVFGNNDGERSGLKKKCQELGVDEIQDSLEFTHAGKRFYVNHGTNPATIDAAIAKQTYDYVLHGHTHLMRNELIGKTRVINPGALFAADPFSVAFLNPLEDTVEFCELAE